MKDKETLDLLDSVCNTVIMKLYSISHGQQLKLKGYDDDDYRHRAILQLAHSFNSITKIPVYVHGGIKGFFAIRRKKLKWLWFGYKGVKIDSIVHQIEKAFEQPFILAQVYETYYK